LSANHSLVLLEQGKIMTASELETLLKHVENSLSVDGEHVQVTDEPKLRATISQLSRVSALGAGREQALSRFLIRAAARELGIVPASINEVYMARGRGEIPPTFTVPAMNLRVMTFEAAKAVFRNAHAINAGAFIFEIARSEIGYTHQRPAEYVSTLLAAAIAEGHRGPIFVQGDHFQISASRYKADPDAEVQTVKDLITEAIAAGFYNIDVDTSTLVDISFDDVHKQQALNTRLSAELTDYIRSLEPDDVTVSVGGEIGEVGGHNSTEEELRAYVEGYQKQLAALNPDAEGLSKISIQTGTSHGGTVLPDGSIAQVAVDFDTMLKLSRIARQEYGAAGAVQHGASTLPQEAFGKFVEAEACEIHLATNFQNIFFDHAPDELIQEMYAYLDENHAGDRKEGQTEEQFYYKTRKQAIGPFKDAAWSLPDAPRARIVDAWNAQFKHLFNALNIADTKGYVDTFTTLPKGMPSMADYLATAGETVEAENVADLSD